MKSVKWARVGFTGTRHDVTAEQVIALRELLATMPLELHHGNCVGADTVAHNLCLELHVPIVMYPTLHRLQAANQGAREVKPVTLGRFAELTRNRAIVDATDLVIACPREMRETIRSGTWATVRYAQQKKKPVIILWPLQLNGDNR